MATVSFKSKQAAAPEPDDIIPTAAPDLTPAVSPPRTLGSPLPADVFAGSWDQSDIRLPYINLVHKTSDSERITAFGIGSFIFNGEVKLSDGKIPLVVTALRALKDFVQVLPFGSVGAAIFKTAEEAEAAGFTTRYSKTAKEAGTYAGPRGHIQFVFEMPPGTDEEGSALFPYEFDGKAFAKGILTVSSSGYTSVARELSTLCANNKVMRSGPYYGKLELTSKTVAHPTHPWLIPVIKYAGANSPEFVEFAQGL